MTVTEHGPQPAPRPDPQPTAAPTGPPTAPPAWRRLLDERWVQGGVVTVVVLAVYLLTCAESNPFNQFVRLADAFLDGRAYLAAPPDYLELARYGPDGLACQGGGPGCRGYVVEPPVPALLLVPFVVLFGTALNQVYVSVLVGAAAMGLFWVATRQLGWTYARSVALTVLLAFGTNLWWAAGDGSVWTFAHVCAVLFLMAALVEATGRKRAWLVGLLVGLAGLSRLPVFLAFPFFLVLTLDGDLPPLRQWRSALREPAVRGRLLQFGVGLGAMAVVVPLYNLLRYGTIADGGYDHPQYAESSWFADGRFALAHVPRHVEALFTLGPQFTPDRFPFFTPTTAGMALFLVSPALLYALVARRGRVEAAAAVATLLVMVPHVLYGTTGWAQFGYRFSLDYLPMLAVLAASGMGPRPGVRAWAAVALSVLVAMWGPLFFFDTPIEAVIGVEWNLP